MARIRKFSLVKGRDPSHETIEIYDSLSENNQRIRSLALLLGFGAGSGIETEIPCLSNMIAELAEESEELASRLVHMAPLAPEVERSPTDGTDQT